MSTSIKFINEECIIRDIIGSTKPRNGFVVFEVTNDSTRDMSILIKFEGEDDYRFICCSPIPCKTGYEYYDLMYPGLYYQSISSCLENFY